MSREDRRALEIVDFWLSAGPARWFARHDGFDRDCNGLLADRDRARLGECAAWAETAAGSLALLILFDQVPRNVFRGSPEQFATDELALAAAEAAVAAGHDLAVPWPAKNFMYLPFQHAEDMAAQDRSLDLYRRSGQQEFYYYALVHADAIRRFGRFPHRNWVLGRTTTDAERAYLASGGFAN